ncbi:MAG: hypothetical protein ACKPKO_24305, partial [Candidatus Fonsibacter sp.]
MVLVAMVGRPIEDALTSHQAAKQGGDMGRNISRVTEHLRGERLSGHSCFSTQLWNGVLGQVCPLLKGICEAVDDAGIQDCPAVVFADQSK